jgi:single stranded DNA-binding protein
MSTVGIICAFTGRLARDAELKRVRGGELPLLSFTCAVEQQGEGQHTTWCRVAVFGPPGEALAGQLEKGDWVYVEGRLTLEQFTGRDGKPKAVLNVVASLVQPLGQIGRRRPREAKPRPEPTHAGAPAQHERPFDDQLDDV